MTGAALERFLAQLYTDAVVRRGFLADRERVARAAHLDPEEVRAVLAIDARDLELAAASFAQKRANGRRRRWWAWFRRGL